MQVTGGLFKIHPWSPSFPPEPPLLLGYFQHCSAPSLVLCWCLTSQWRTCWDCGLRPSPTAPAWKLQVPEAIEISRFSSIERPRMHRVLDSAGPQYVSPYSDISRVAFPTTIRSRHPGLGDFGAQWLAYASPVNCFTCNLTAART